MNTDIYYGLVIDTEQYAGSFERDLCAFVTGCIGYCMVGADCIQLPDDPCLFDNVKHVADEHGCYRPCEIYPTEGWFNDGLGGHYRIGEEEIARANYIAKGGRNPEIIAFPAYNSVIIYFYTEPTPQQIAHIKDKLPHFQSFKRNQSKWNEDFQITITGLRLVKFEIVTTITTTNVE